MLMSGVTKRCRSSVFCTESPWRPGGNPPTPRRALQRVELAASKTPVSSISSIGIWRDILGVKVYCTLYTRKDFKINCGRDEWAVGVS